MVYTTIKLNNMKKDSKKKSIIEVTTDVVLGCAIATGLN